MSKMGYSFGQKRNQSKVNFNVGYLFPESDEDFLRLKTDFSCSLLFLAGLHLEHPSAFLDRLLVPYSKLTRIHSTLSSA